MGITYLDKIEAVTEDAGIIESATGVRDAVMDRMTLSFASGLSRSLGQGITFGFADEAEAYIRSALGEGEYTEIRDDIRDNLNKFRADEPAFAYGAEIGAALLTPGGAARLATKAGMKTIADKAVMAAAKRPTAAAGVGGAVYGAGTAEEIEDACRGRRFWCYGHGRSGDGPDRIPHSKSASARRHPGHTRSAFRSRRGKSGAGTDICADDGRWRHQGSRKGYGGVPGHNVWARTASARCHNPADDAAPRCRQQSRRRV